MIANGDSGRTGGNCQRKDIAGDGKDEKTRQELTALVAASAARQTPSRAIPNGPHVMARPREHSRGQTNNHRHASAREKNLAYISLHPLLFC